jgi:hypothetical protein
MKPSDEWSWGEIALTVFVVGVVAAIWSRWPQIKVSAKSLERYDLSNPSAPAWTNGIGLRINIARPKPVDETRELADLLAKYTAYVVTVDIQGAKYPTMVDLPYDRMYLTNAAGQHVRPVNTALSESSRQRTLAPSLETFDWSIVNNTFAGEGRTEKGIVLFPRLENPSSIHINVYHHPYKQIDLDFPLGGAAS